MLKRWSGGSRHVDVVEQMRGNETRGVSTYNSGAGAMRSMNMGMLFFITLLNFPVSILPAWAQTEAAGLGSHVR